MNYLIIILLPDPVKLLRVALLSAGYVTIFPCSVNKQTTFLFTFAHTIVNCYLFTIVLL